MQIEIIVFSNVFGELGRTPQARAFLRCLKGQERTASQDHGDPSGNA